MTQQQRDNIQITIGKYKYAITDKDGKIIEVITTGTKPVGTSSVKADEIMQINDGEFIKYNTLQYLAKYKGEVKSIKLYSITAVANVAEFKATLREYVGILTV